MLGHFKKAGVGPKRVVKEFPVTKDALVPVGVYYYVALIAHTMIMNYSIGTTLSAIHFVPGQLVDVVSKSSVYQTSLIFVLIFP